MTATTAQTLYVELERLLEMGEIESSLDKLDQICLHHCDHGGAWELRGLLEAKADRPNRSVECLERASSLVPLEPWSSRVLAFQYIQIGKRDLGVDLLHQLGISGLVSTNMVRVLTHDLLKLGHPDLAASMIWTAITSDQDNPVLWHELCAVQSVLGEEPGICLQSVERAIQLDPNTVEYRVTAATLLISLDQAMEAYQLVRQVVSHTGINLDCPCCLWRLICLFDCFDDHARMKVCYDRLASASVSCAHTC
ncbi:MAG: hypothetical protein AAGD07_08750 [Planctomycetota bacterium]